ncbi:MAG: serine hydrolase domain-containing protein [Terracidiphilus sp.]
MLARRSFLKSVLSLTAGLGFSRGSCGFAETDSSSIDAQVEDYRSAYDVPGLSLAYGRGKEIILARAYGLADRHDHHPVTTESLFRIASLSKPITAAAVFTLVEAGKLRIGDSIFGPKGLLGSYSLRAHADWLQAITVEHLLKHTAGGWSNKEHDPMFHETSLDHKAFIQRTLDAYPLEAKPGTAYNYSNFGYFLLGRVIEQVSGMPYGEYMRQHVQAPLGISDMQLAGRKPAQNEVHYYGQGRDDPYAVPVELHDANGGWIATPIDLVHFALGVFSARDKGGAPALFQLNTLDELTHGSHANPEYGCGWSVSRYGDCSHSGGFDGSASFMMHRQDGLSWAVVVNTRRAHSEMENDLHKLCWDIEKMVRSSISQL